MFRAGIPLFSLKWKNIILQSVSNFPVLPGRTNTGKYSFRLPHNLPLPSSVFFLSRSFSLTFLSSAVSSWLKTSRQSPLPEHIKCSLELAINPSGF